MKREKKRKDETRLDGLRSTSWDVYAIYDRVERSKSHHSSGYERKQERERIVDYEVSRRGNGRKER